MVSDKPETEKTLEERLMPWIEQGGYVIVLTIIIMAWTAGWVDLLDFDATYPVVLGRYTVPYFIILVVYTLASGLWFWMFGTLRGVLAFKRGIAGVQKRWWLFLLVLAVFGVLFASIIDGPIADGWLQLNLLQGVLVLLALLFVIVVAIARPDSDMEVALWRKVVIWSLVGVLGVELFLQFLTAIDVYPVQIYSGIHVPYGRVYQTETGRANHATNRFGFYDQDYGFRSAEYRIVLNGGSVVQALQVPIEDHMDETLQALLTGDDEEQAINVLTQGTFGYGSAITLDRSLARLATLPVSPNEVIIFFHLTNDWVLSPETGSKLPDYVTYEGEEIQIGSDNYNYWHGLATPIADGFGPVRPIRLMRSHSMLLNLLSDLSGGRLPAPEVAPRIVQHTQQATAEKPFGPATVVYSVDADPEIFEVTAEAFHEYVAYVVATDTVVRLVTIPYFPADFLNGGGEWSTQYGDYDLMHPEAELKAMAENENVSFLGMTETMQSESRETVRSFFFEENPLYLTAAGHQYFGEALYDCFYAEDSPAPEGCSR